MNIPDAVILTTSISVTTFFLGFIIREWILLYSNNNRLRNSNSHIEWNLDRLIKGLSNQIHGFTDLTTNIKAEGYRNLYIEPSLIPEIVIQKEELLHSLIFNRKKSSKEDKSQIFNSIITQCLVVKSILDETNLMFDKFNNLILTYEVKLDETGIRLYQKIMSSRSKSDSNLMEEQILKIYNDYCQIKTNKRSIFHSELINKIEALIIKENYPSLIEFLELTSQYQKDYIYYKETLKHFQVKVEEYGKALITSKTILTESVLAYRNMKFKSNWLR